MKRLHSSSAVRSDNLLKMSAQLNELSVCLELLCTVIFIFPHINKECEILYDDYYYYNPKCLTSNYIFYRSVQPTLTVCVFHMLRKLNCVCQCNQMINQTINEILLITNQKQVSSEGQCLQDKIPPAGLTAEIKELERALRWCNKQISGSHEEQDQG